MATPTLTMIPSGYKAEKVYSVLPTNGDGDFTFNRNDTATRVNKSGLIEQVATDIPRLDYSDGSCPSLLLEPQSTNLITKSNEVTSVGGAIITLNSAISPDGTLNAFKIKFTGGSSNVGGLLNLENQTANFAASTVYTLSFYAKNLVGNGQFTARIDTDVSIVKQESFTATSNWQRYTMSFTTDLGSTTFSSNSRFRNFQENGEVLFYGVQLEKGIATSLIPTTTQPETRSAESFSNDFSSQPTVANTNTVVLKFITMGFSTDFFKLLKFSGVDGELRLEGFSTNNYDVYGTGLTSSGMIDGALQLDAGSINIISFSYSGTSLRFSHNGSTINTTTPTGNLPTITQVLHSVGSESPIKILDLRVYNEFKTQTEINTLTTI